MIIIIAALCLITESGYAEITNVIGWEYKGVTYYPNQEGSVIGGTDINGEVGHPLSLHGPTAHCPPSGDWKAYGEVISGSLPPGIKFNNDTGGDWSISGIPKERGHWIVTMKVSNLQCNGESYLGFTQQLRFHITGTGKVIE